MKLLSDLSGTDNLTNLNIFRIKEVDKSFEKPILSIDLIEEESGKILGTWTKELKNQETTDFRGEDYLINFDSTCRTIVEQNHTQ